MATQRDRWEFIHLMMKHTAAPEPEVQRAAVRLLRYGATLRRLYTDLCNGPNYERCHNEADYAFTLKEWQRYQDRIPPKKDRIKAKVTMLCASIGCKPLFQSDPRGATLKIVVPDGYTNDWGREGICVPTS